MDLDFLQSFRAVMMTFYILLGDLGLICLLICGFTPDFVISCLGVDILGTFRGWSD
jgi:hypothetical protein